MIYIDDRTGSLDLVPIFQAHRTAPAVSTRRLPAADVCFTGCGPQGPASVGVERKSITSRDMLSSMRTGRFLGEQLPKLLDHFEYPYLVVEGWETVRVNYTTGLLEERAGRGWYPLTLGRQPFLALELSSYLQTVETMSRVRVHHTENAAGTVEDVLSLHHWFAKPWDRHHIQALHTPPEYATIGKASTVRRVAAALNGLGWERSNNVNMRTPSVAHMICRDPQKCIECGNARMPQDWVLPSSGEKVKDGIGKVLSRRVWDELHGRHVEGAIE